MSHKFCRRVSAKIAALAGQLALGFELPAVEQPKPPVPQPRRLVSAPIVEQLAFDFLAALPSAAPVSALAPLRLVSVEPIPTPDFEALAAEVVTLPVQTPVAKRETLFDFLIRHGQLSTYTKKAMVSSKVGAALTDEHLRLDFTQAAHERWNEIKVDPSMDDRQVFALANLVAPQAIQKTASRSIGAVYVPPKRNDRGDGQRYAAVVTASRNPFDVADYADNRELSVEDEIYDQADLEFLENRLAVLDIEPTKLQRRIAELLLIEKLGADEIAVQVKLGRRCVDNHISTLTKAFHRANDRDLGLLRKAA